MGYRILEENGKNNANDSNIPPKKIIYL